MPQPPEEAIHALCRRILDDPARGAAALIRIAGSCPRGSDERTRSLLTDLLPSVPDPDLALLHLERYCSEQPLPHDPEGMQVLLVLLGFSPYLAESVIREPGCLADLVRARRREVWGVEEYRNDLARWLRLTPSEDPWDALRAFRRRANLRIALRDLQRSAPLPEVAREISDAADALLQTGLDLALDRARARFGRPQAYDENGRILDASMTVLGLGKLGGRELNYSSDVDLLFLYTRDGETTGVDDRPETQITNKEFFTWVAEDLAKGLSQISVEGQVFRVDCRLRPGGRDGDLVTPLQAALVYYRTWARPWERQALIKARPCAGDQELGAAFLEGVETIVYPMQPDPRLAANVRGMKDRIDADLARRGRGADHLKLGRGGIREIEFAVQAMQMFHGGADPWVRGANTLLALHRLADKGYLSVAEHGALSTAYTFLREAEHRLQIHHNLQRSELPSQPRDRRILARAMGYRDHMHRQEAAAFMSDLDARRGDVRSIYDMILSRLSQVRLEDSPGPDPFLDRMPDSELVERLARAGFEDGESVVGSVRAIARLLAPPAAGPELRRAFRALTPQLLEETARVRQPVRALRNLERFLASVGLDPEQMRSFVARREMVAPLVRLFAGSQFLSAALINRPALVLEENFDRAIARDRTVADHLLRIEEARRNGADRQGMAPFLRVYQRSQLLYIVLKEVNGQSGPAAVGRALSDLAEAILRTVVAAAAAETGWGTPDGFCVLGLGKMGYRELDYASDLDLVFLYAADGSAAGERHAAANRVAGTVMEMLTSITREGALYSVDTRLRPFGGEGELAQPVQRVLEYLDAVAGVWELQSFLKARPLAGDPDLGGRTAAEIERRILRRAPGEDLARAVREMKERLEQHAASRRGTGPDIKHGPGGLNAIQFAIQYLQLRHGIPSPSHKRTSRLLSTLRSRGLLDEGAYRVLFTGFRFLRRLEHRMRLIHGRALTRLPSSADALEEIAAAMGYPRGREEPARDRLLADLSRHRLSIEATYRRVVEQPALPERIEA